MKFFRKFLPQEKVFLDYASITPVSPSVLGAMKKVQKNFTNPSALYTDAILSKDLIKNSRKKIAEVLNCQKENIVFTGSGTEANNLALLGIFEAFKTETFSPHFIVTNIEHPAILEVCDEIERRGGSVTKIPVNEEGLVSPKDILSALKPETVLVSVMYANNEIGTIQPIKEIGKVVKEYRNKNNNSYPYFHTDACQASLYLSLDVLKINVDLLTLDAIKMYGPRGIGLLYVGRQVKIKPIIFGGGQEGGLRSGTENLPAIVGFAKAIEEAEENKKNETERLLILRNYAIDEILKNFKTASLNGSREYRLPNNLNICFDKLDAEFAVIQLDVLGISASYSSSCRTLKEDSSSYVVENLGKDSCKNSSLRFTLGSGTKKKDIDFLVTALKKIVIV